MTLRSRLPTTRADWYRTAALVGTVVSRPRYAALSVVAGAANVVVFVAARNARLVRDVVLFGSGSTATRLSVFVNLLPVVGGGLESASAAALLTFGALAGVTFAAVVFRLRRAGARGAAGTGAAGAVLGTAGIGCAACGVPALAALTGTAGASAIAALPLGGTELLGFGIALLGLSLFRLADDAGDACAVDGPE